MVAFFALAIAHVNVMPNSSQDLRQRLETAESASRASKEAEETLAVELRAAKAQLDSAKAEVCAYNPRSRTWCMQALVSICSVC